MSLLGEEPKAKRFNGTIEKNKAILVKPRLAHAQWLFARLAPTLMNRVSVGFIEKQRAGQATGRSHTV